MIILDSRSVKIPDFAGLNIRQVAELIQQGMLALIPHGSGEAFKQKPDPGTILHSNDSVEVWFK